MTFTIEPMIAAGRRGSTACGTTTGPRSPSTAAASAQFEHTIVVTDDGADILTLHEDGRWNGDGGQPGDPEVG